MQGDQPEDVVPGSLKAADSRLSLGLFTIDEAARHLGIPRSTLRDWTRRMAGPAPLVHRANPASPHAASVPFIGAVEAHLLRGLRELGTSARQLRRAVTELREWTGDEFALAAEPWQQVRDGPPGLPAVIGEYLTDVTWRAGDRYPVRLALKGYHGASVVIDPRFAFGQPVLEREKIRVEDILDAYWSGETSRAIAREFGVSAAAVEAVIRSATRPRAA